MDLRDGETDLIARRKFLQGGLAAGAAFVSAPSVRADELPLGLLPGTRFPDARIEVLDRRFNKYRVENAGIQRVATGFGWCEGPVYFRDGGYLLFSDIPNNRIMQSARVTRRVSCSQVINLPTATRAIARAGAVHDVRAPFTSSLSASVR